MREGKNGGGLTEVFVQVEEMAKMGDDVVHYVCPLEMAGWI